MEIERKRAKRILKRANKSKVRKARLNSVKDRLMAARLRGRLPN